jgi:cytochrome c biogenesis protein CcdA
VNPLLLLEEVPALAPLVGVLVGVVLAASPLAWPMAVAAVATGVASSDDGRVAWRPVVAVGAGITAVYVVLGLLVGAIDALVRDVLGASAGIVLAVLAVLAVGGGIVLVVRPLAACRTRMQRPRGSSGAAVLLGVLLSAVTCPACAGVVTGVAVSAAAGWGAPSAVLAMLGLGIGHTLALVLLARLVHPFTVGTRHLHTAQRVAGVALVAVGLFFAWQAYGTGTTVGPTLP